MHCESRSADIPTSAANATSRGSEKVPESERYRNFGPWAGMGELAAVDVGGDCGVFPDDSTASIDGGRGCKFSVFGGPG